MNAREQHSSDSERDPHVSDARPPKRARYSSPHDERRMSNGNGNGNGVAHGDGGRYGSRSGGEDGAEVGEGSAGLPLLAPSIVGVEPLDEFIREIADFVYFHINNRPQDGGGSIEVEAKIGVMRERGPGGQRLQLPVLVETSTFARSLARWIAVF